MSQRNKNSPQKEQITSQATTSQAHKNYISHYWTHQYLDLCSHMTTTDPVAALLSLASNRARDNLIVSTATSIAAAETTQHRIVMVPVAAVDFRKMNEMAEALMIVKHPQKAEQIKGMRSKLLKNHNIGSSGPLFLPDYYCSCCFSAIMPRFGP